MAKLSLGVPLTRPHLSGCMIFSVQHTRGNTMSRTGCTRCTTLVLCSYSRSQSSKQSGAERARSSCHWSSQMAARRSLRASACMLPQKVTLSHSFQIQFYPCVVFKLPRSVQLQDFAVMCKHAVCAATAQSVTLAAPPPLPADSLYHEVVDARLGEGLHFRRGGQTVRFGDSPQVLPSHSS